MTTRLLNNLPATSAVTLMLTLAAVPAFASDGAAPGGTPPSAQAATTGLQLSSPKTVVEPTYPAGALSAGVAGRVDVKATIDAKGVPTIVSIQAEPEGHGFEEAVATVFADWRFNPPLSTKTCMLLTEPTITRVFFEVQEGRPGIRHSKLTGPWANLSNRDQVSALVSRGLRDRQFSGNAVLRIAVTVDGAKAEARDVRVTSATGTGALGAVHAIAREVIFKFARFHVREEFTDQVFVQCIQLNI